MFLIIKLLSNLNNFCYALKNFCFTFFFISFRTATILLQLLFQKKKKHLFTFSFRGSLTVEASVVLPILVGVAASIMIFFRVLMIGWGIEVCNVDVARSTAISGQVLNNVGSEGGILKKASLVALSQGEILVKKVPTKFIFGDRVGILYTESEVSGKDIIIKSAYKIKMPVGFFNIKYLNIKQETVARRWLGYNPLESLDESKSVYITKSGVAYHKDIDCKYLNPSIHSVSSKDLESKRNESGGKYYKCERCVKGKSSIYYISDFGSVFHSTITCPTFSRTINKVSIGEAKRKGFHACGKCA